MKDLQKLLLIGVLLIFLGALQIEGTLGATELIGLEISGVLAICDDGDHGGNQTHDGQAPDGVTEEGLDGGDGGDQDHSHIRGDHYDYGEALGGQLGEEQSDQHDNEEGHRQTKTGANEVQQGLDEESAEAGGGGENDDRAHADRDYRSCDRVSHYVRHLFLHILMQGCVAK